MNENERTGGLTFVVAVVAMGWRALLRAPANTPEIVFYHGAERRELGDYGNRWHERADQSEGWSAYLCRHSADGRRHRVKPKRIDCYCNGGSGNACEL